MDLPSQRCSTTNLIKTKKVLNHEKNYLPFVRPYYGLCFPKKHGQPTYSSELVDYYAALGISLRTKPHEISFVSENVRYEYNEYMKSLK